MVDILLQSLYKDMINIKPKIKIILIKETIKEEGDIEVIKEGIITIKKILMNHTINIIKKGIMDKTSNMKKDTNIISHKISLIINLMNMRMIIKMIGQEAIINPIKDTKKDIIEILSICKMVKWLIEKC